MKIPTPSFFKIRIVVVFLAFLFLCFFVGLVKQVFADDYECYVTLGVLENTGGGNSYHETGLVRTENGGYLTSTGSEFGISYTAWKFIIYGFIGSRWNQVGVVQRFWLDASSTSVDSISVNVTIYDVLPEVCPVPCTDEDRQAAYEECGGEELTNFFNDTCTYTCKTCQGPGEEDVSAAAERCGGIELLAFHDEETCRGICKDTCTQEQYNSVKEQCGKMGFEFSEVTCDGDCKSCDPEWAKQQAQGICGNDGVAVGYSCIGTAEDGFSVPPDTVICDGGTITQYPRTGSGEVEKPDEKDQNDPEHPDNKDKVEDPESSNEVDKAAIKQRNEMNAELNKQTANQEWIGKNTQATANNTQEILKQLQDGVNVKTDKGLGKKIDNIEGDLGSIKVDVDQIADTLGNISNGEYTTPTEQEKYSVEEEYSFEERTDQFLSDMRSTGLFSLPDKIADSIPGGGSPVYTVDMGETFGGTHTLNLNYLATSLLILRSFYLVGCMAIGIRIVTLKR